MVERNEQGGMKHPRMGFTVRRAMIAIAAVAVVLGAGIGMVRRSERLLEISWAHFRPVSVEGTLILTVEGFGYVGITSAKGRWHEAMRRKYAYYGRRPWLPIPPDPPEPE